MSKKSETSKYLYLTINEMEYLHGKAADLKMYLKGANMVLKDVLGIIKESKKKPQSSPRLGKKTLLRLPEKESTTTKVRVEPAVWSAWKLIRAKAGGQNASHQLIQQAIDWFYEQKSEDEGGGGPRTASGRPATR